MCVGGFSDQELIKVCLSGNQMAFAVLMMRYKPLLFKIIIKILKNPESSEDTLQDVFLKVFTKLNSFEGRSSFKSWVCKIAVNCAKNILRSKKETVEFEDQDHHCVSEFESDYSQLQIKQKLYGMIQQLPEKQKLVMELRVFKDLSFTEIAKILQCPYDTAKANYRHAMIKMRETIC